MHACCGRVAVLTAAPAAPLHSAPAAPCAATRPPPAQRPAAASGLRTSCLLALRYAASWPSSHQPRPTSQLRKRATGSRARHARISSDVRYLCQVRAHTRTGGGMCVVRVRVWVNCTYGIRHHNNVRHRHARMNARALTFASIPPLVFVR